MSKSSNWANTWWPPLGDCTEAKPPITVFLLARITEDEAAAQDPRTLKECKAKRAIIDHAVTVGCDGLYAADYMPERRMAPGAVDDGRIHPGHPRFGQTAIYSRTLRTLAAVYSDHPDYQSVWSMS